MSTYGVIGGTLWGNRGAEAMVVTTMGQVRRRDPEATFDIWTYQPATDRALLGESADRVFNAKPARLALVHMPLALVVGALRVIKVRWPQALLPNDVRALRRERALFDVTGISFHDGRLSVSIYNVVCLWPAILMGVPVIRLSQAMGPFKQPLNRWGARFIMNHSHHSYARGAATAEFVKGLKVRADRWSVAPDVAFGYEDSFSVTTENADRVAAASAELAAVAENGKKVVAVVPSSLVMKSMAGQGEDYVGVLAGLVATLQSKGFHVLVAPNATSEGSASLRNNDLVPIVALAERLDAVAEGEATNVTIVDYDVNTESIRALLSACEVVITSRFHAMVAALALGIPTLVIGWSHKYGEVLEMFGCEDDAIDFSEAADKAGDKIEAMIAERAARREKIASHVADVKAASTAQFDVIDSLPTR